MLACKLPLVASNYQFSYLWLLASRRKPTGNEHRRSSRCLTWSCREVMKPQLRLAYSRSTKCPSTYSLSSQPDCKSPEACDYQAGRKWDTLWPCWGRDCGEFGYILFFFRAPYKNIWGFIDAGSALLTTRLRFLFLEDVCGGIFTLLATDSFSVALTELMAYSC